MYYIEVTGDMILEETWSDIQMVTRETSFKHLTAHWEEEIFGTARTTLSKLSIIHSL